MHYYRICSINEKGELIYSDIMRIIVNTSKPEIVVYPNPVVDRRINLNFINQPKGYYALRLIDNSGRVLIKKEINLSESNVLQTIKAGKNIVGGSYHLDVTGPDKSVKSISVLLQ